MKSERITAVKMEMERLSTRIAEYELAESGTNNKRTRYSTVAESGAVKRASMDLTRALADLRRSNYR